MKSIINLSFAIITITFLLCSCHDNRIYFDIEKQSVNSCNKQIIMHLVVLGLKNSDEYFFNLKEGQEGTNVFLINHPTCDYNLMFTYLPENKICDEIKNFRLKPNASYQVINMTNGDASESIILIKTDDQGNVISSNRINCN